ncbi:MAG TPA: sigma factor-like helix-turn-helix DNA-binding protein [Longimicrobiaceae bacterium]
MHTRELSVPPSAKPHTLMVYDLQRLSESDRTLLALFYYEQLNLDQIATVLGVPEEKVAESFYLAHVELGLCAEVEEAVGSGSGG